MEVRMKRDKGRQTRISYYLKKAYERGELTDSQIARLNEIGFDFEISTFDPRKDSLAVKMPQLVEIWDRERNGSLTPYDVRPKSARAVWWHCPACDRPYLVSIRSKSNLDSGCPYCGHGGSRARVKIPIICLDTNERFSGVREAERAVGYSISNCIRTSIPDRNGLTWCYLVDYEMGRIPRHNKRNRMGSVYCLETGESFENQKEAEQAYGMSAGSVSRVLDTDRKASGFHWVSAVNYSEECSKCAQVEGQAGKVVCLETGERFETYAAAGRSLGVTGDAIKRATRSRTHRIGDFHVMSSFEFDALVKDDLEAILEADRLDQIVCVETGEVFPNITSAAESFPADSFSSARSGIGCCCRKKNRTYAGFHWCRQRDLEDRIDHYGRFAQHVKTPVFCNETGVEYESLAEAGRRTGINSNSIRLAASGERKMAGGFTWSYVKDPKPRSDNRGKNQPSSQRVRCVETGAVFPSLQAAAREMGLKAGASIKKAAVRGGTSAGYHWETVDC